MILLNKKQKQAICIFKRLHKTQLTWSVEPTAFWRKTIRPDIYKGPQTTDVWLRYFKNSNHLKSTAMIKKNDNEKRGEVITT